MDFRTTYLAAVKRDQDVRDAAFLSLTTDICGVKIRQMTPRDLIILDGLGNAFISGAERTSKAALSFLWHLSPGYRRGKKSAFEFVRKHLKKNAVKVFAAIEDYLDDTFQDSPGKKGGESGPDFASFAAHLVHRLASNYGWTPDYIIGTAKQRGLPLKVVFQLLKCIRNEKEEKPELRSRRILKVNGDRLRAVNAKNALIVERQKLVDVLAKRARN